MWLPKKQGKGNVFFSYVAKILDNSGVAKAFLMWEGCGALHLGCCPGEKKWRGCSLHLVKRGGCKTNDFEKRGGHIPCYTGSSIHGQSTRRALVSHAYIDSM